MTTLRVRYPETDQMGVVHHSHYLVWFEIGRTELMREAGCAYSEMEKTGIRMPVIEAAYQHYSRAVEQGLGDQVFFATLRTIEEAAGVELAPLEA